MVKHSQAQVAWWCLPGGGVEIGDQQPRLGNDPEFRAGSQILVDMRWLNLAEIPERDRVYLWAAGLLGIPAFQAEVEGWGDALSYPSDQI